MTIIESRPPEFVRIRLEFIKPFAATHTAEFLLKAEGDNTTVTWSMSGTNNFVAKGVQFVDEYGQNDRRTVRKRPSAAREGRYSKRLRVKD